MTILMDNTLGNLSRERAQRLFNKNVELENRRRKATQARIPSDPNAWQQMRENYESIILEDHAFSEQHDIEYALWQLHYRRIEELRAHFTAALTSASQNVKASSRSAPDRITKIRSQFKTFLSEATGFYHDLMVKIRAKYGLSLGYFSDDPENEIAALSKDGSKSVDLKKGLISCHRCFIYLGDLARYKGLYGEGDSKARDFAAASSYYIQASSLLPSSGNPHHQLAILASYSGDELLAVYRYFRSLSVDNPFTTARDNLIIAFEKNRQSYSQLLGDSKTAAAKKGSLRMAGKGRGKGETGVSLKDRKAEISLLEEREPNIPETFKTFSIRFVRLNGILFTRTSLETFGEVFSATRRDLLQLLSFGPDEVYSFGSDAAECALFIVRLIAILIFTVHNVNKETGSQSYAEILQRSVVLQNAFTATFEFMAHILDRCTQTNDPSESFLLPGIMIFVEWLACCQDIAVRSELEEKEAVARSLFWNHCVLFFNKLLMSGCHSNYEDEDETCFFNMKRYDEVETANRLALPEDIELRGFLPLLPAQLILDFSRKRYIGGDGGNKENGARIQRVMAAGKALANVVRDGQQGLYYDTKLKRFTFGVEPQVSDDISHPSSLDVPLINGKGQDIHVESKTHCGILQLKAQSYEGEDEDEVIVFKPSVTEKHIDRFALSLSSSEVNGHGVNTSRIGLGSNAASSAISNEGFLLGPPTSFSSIPEQYMQPAQPNTSKWMVENQGFIENVASLNLLGKGPPVKSELEEHLGVFQPSAVPVPGPPTVDINSGNGYSVQVPEIALPWKFDSVVSSGAGADRLFIKPASINSAVGKKNPVSRPVRHFGPPPGFGSVPPKTLDELIPGVNVKNENQPVDDYSGLDGYHLPMSVCSDGLGSSINHAAQAYKHVNKSTTPTGMVTFPFPGKQVLTAQSQMENWNGWQDYQLPEHLKLYEQQQQQLKTANEQLLALPQQYQGQSLWEGRFFV